MRLNLLTCVLLLATVPVEAKRAKKALKGLPPRHRAG